MAQTNEMRFSGSQLDTERMFKSNEGLASKEAVLYKVNSNDLYAMVSADGFSQPSTENTEGGGQRPPPLAASSR